MKIQNIDRWEEAKRTGAEVKLVKSVVCVFEYTIWMCVRALAWVACCCEIFMVIPLPNSWIPLDRMTLESLRWQAQRWPQALPPKCPPPKRARCHSVVYKKNQENPHFPGFWGAVTPLLWELRSWNFAIRRFMWTTTQVPNGKLIALSGKKLWHHPQNRKFSVGIVTYDR